MLSVTTSSFQFIEFRQQPIADLGPRHPHERDLTAEPGAEIRPVLAVLAVESLGPRAVEDRPEAADFLSANAGPIVDHEARYHLRGALAQDPCFCFVDREPFVLRDVTYPRHHIADPICQSLIARECEVVGISGIRQPELGGESGQPAIEPARDLVRQAGTGTCALGQSAGPVAT